jgi:hypothetical protein
MDELRRTLYVVQDERANALQDKARDAERMSILEREIQEAKRQSLRASYASQASAETDATAMLMKSLAQQVQVLSRVQAANEDDKQQLAVRNAELERQVQESMATAERLKQAHRSKGTRPSKRDQAAIDQLQQERVELAQALDEATRERAVAKMEAERALELLEDMEEQLRGGGGGGTGGDALRLQLLDLKTRQKMFQSDYHSLQSENVQLMRRLDTSAQLNAAAVAEAQAQADAEEEEVADANAVASMALTIDGDEPTRTRGGGGGAAAELPVARRAGAGGGAAGTHTHTHGRTMLHLQGSDHFEEELEDVMEDQIDWRELMRDLGSGLKELVVALWGACVFVGAAFAQCVSEKAKEARDRREINKRMNEKGGLDAERWISEFKSSPAADGNPRATPSTDYL